MSSRLCTHCNALICNLSLGLSTGSLQRGRAKVTSQVAGWQLNTNDWPQQDAKNPNTCFGTCGSSSLTFNNILSTSASRLNVCTVRGTAHRKRNTGKCLGRGGGFSAFKHFLLLCSRARGCLRWAQPRETWSAQRYKSLIINQPDTVPFIQWAVEALDLL